MKIIHGSKGSGKTTALIKESNQKQMYILCANPIRVKQIAEMARKMKLTIPYPLSVSDVGTFSNRIDSILIDDIDDVLQHLLNVRVEVITTSCEIEEINPKMNEVIT